MAEPPSPDRTLWEGYHRGILESLPDLRLTLPNLTFETALEFHGPKRTAKVVDLGGGHTDSDAALILPDDRVAFLSDLLFVGYQPYLGYGDPGEWLRILSQIEALGLEVVVPGHGPVGKAADIAPMRRYIQELERTVNQAPESITAKELAVLSPVSATFNDWKFRSFYEENLEFLLGRRKKER
jgi:cyclase